jgi:uncharacterized membrane protein YfbV (UPF0208 family)
MTRSQSSFASRAALMSLLLFPGVGLMWLGERVRGAIFAVPVLAIIVMWMRDIWRAAREYTEALVASGAPSFTELYASLFDKTHELLFASVWWQEGKMVLLASWLLSVVSSWVVGKRRDIALRKL